VWLWLSTADALSATVPPEAMELGDPDAVTDTVCVVVAAACSVIVAEPVPVTAGEPPQVAVTVRTSVRSAPLLFAAAV